jgi:hypothetical protein
MSRIEYTPNPPPQTLTEKSSQDLALYLQNELAQISNFIGEITDVGTVFNPNLLINGDFSVNQDSFAGGQPAAGVYGYDMWKGDTLGTRIEQVVSNTRTYNETFTISWVGGTGTADVDGVTGLYSGDSFILDTSTNFSVIVPTDATDIKLEQGGVQTPFPYTSPQVMMSECQRYYIKSGDLEEYRGQQASGAIGGLGSTVRFPVEMDSIPTITLSGITYTNASSLSMADVQASGFRFTWTGAAGGTRVTFDWVADARL